MELIDIHCHILPDIDDGPSEFEDSVRILEEAKKQGVTHIFMTPHYRRDMFEPRMNKIVKNFNELRGLAKKIGISIHLGCEYHRNENIVFDFKNKRRPTMAKSKYVLVEFSGADSFSVIRNYCYDLKINGFFPIIAHVERYDSCRKLELINELKEMGVLIQINASSVLGKYGMSVKRYCIQLIKHDMIDYIASDTHNLTDRQINLGAAANYVTNKMGKEYAKRIFYDNPFRILESMRNETN